MNAFNKSMTGRCLFRKVTGVLVHGTVALLLFGCASSYEKSISTLTSEFSSVGDVTKPKSIFVLMDGTANNPTLPSNIYRTYKELKQNNDRQTIALYLYGVGNEDNPKFGKAIALGMENRTKQAYAYITRNYKPGDRIYLFGFSRGALSARSLAGLISYAGIPRISDSEREAGVLLGIADEVIDLTKDVRDSDYKEAWKRWKPGDKPLLAGIIRDEKINGNKGRDVLPAEVEFLGVWDTVPGSEFLMNEYFGDTDVSCKEAIDWNKAIGLSIAQGERYKTDSYPAIRYIAHAVSNDEKRSMFRPLFICSKSINPSSVINPNYTTVNETVFPGAHADVGGGYEDLNNELPSLSLNWMMSLLRQHYFFPSRPNEFSEANPKGLAHLSISDSGGSVLSNCRDRKLPRLITIDPSVKDREKAGAVPLAIYGNLDHSNPSGLSCGQEKYVNESKQENIKCVDQRNVNCAYVIQQKWTDSKWDRD